MKTKNPFETLGIAPSIVRALDGKELFSLIKSSYRALLLIYHPDHSPLHDQALKEQKTRKVAEINLALEKINLDRDPASLKHYRNLYIRKKGDGWKKAVRLLQQEIGFLKHSNEMLSRGYLQYLLTLSFPEQQDHRETIPGIFNLRNCRLGIQDIAINHNVRSMSWDLGTNYKEIKCDSEGRMFYKMPCRKRFLQVNFIKLLGTVEKDKIDLIPLLDRVVPQDLVIRQGSGKKGYAENAKGFDILNSLPVEEFRRHCLPFLKPEITEGAFLFSLHRQSLQENRINLEGLIIRVHRGV
jgi:hypothetical protein